MVRHGVIGVQAVDTARQGRGEVGGLGSGRQPQADLGPLWEDHRECHERRPGVGAVPRARVRRRRKMPREAMDAGHRADQERWPVIQSLLLLLLLLTTATLLLLLLLLLMTSAPLLLLLLLLLLLASEALLLLLLLLLMTSAPLLLLLLLLLLLASEALLLLLLLLLLPPVVTVMVPAAASASRAVPRGRRPDDLLGRAGGVGGLRLDRDRGDEGRSRHDGSSQCFFEHGYPSVGSVLRKRTTSEFTELESIHRTLDLDPDSHARGSKRPSRPSGGK
ncbi:hypothetical protein ACQPZZ_18450 [Microbispora sp. CA-135349]|uniref:hypothetical protein n=1 Tax=Microbispora sp. CA-135349 TaxID=3239953 RepID=UPI003D8E6660